MAWTEIVIEISKAHAEKLSDALMEIGTLSVSVEDADEGTDQEKPLFGEPGMEPTEHAWERSRVVALIDEHQNATSLIQQACQDIGISDLPSVITRKVEDQDWVRLTQSQFEPIHIGENIWVVPSWHDAPVKDALVLELDPGLAFGTGSHPTTRLCMEWLESNPPQASVLDYGCGSGILALVAKKLAASHVVGVDIDEQAIESAHYNAQRNQCNIEFYLPELFAEKYAPDLHNEQSQFEVVVANILSSPLKLMAPMLASRVKQGGDLVLSGVLARQAEEVIAAYAPFMTLNIWAERDGWVALHGCKS